MARKGKAEAQVSVVEKHAEPPVLVNAVAPVPVPEVRIRARGVQIVCPACGCDAFVARTMKHPGVIEERVRYYKCGACGKSFKP